MPTTFESKVTQFAVRIPRGEGFYAPHGHVVKFLTEKERDRYLKRCCDSCKALTIPPFIP
jgi:hypothetical protein